MANVKTDAATVITDLTALADGFLVTRDAGNRTVLSWGEANADGVSLTQAAMKYLGGLPSEKFFVGILKGQLVVREL